MKMSKWFPMLALCLAFCLPSFAQTVTLPNAPVAATDVQNLYAAGVSYSQGATPSVAGTLIYAHEIGESNTYAFTVIDALPSTLKPFTVTTNIGAGVAQKILTIGNVPIFAPATAGFSYTGNNAGWNYSGGVAAIFKLKGDWAIMPTARFLKNNVSDGNSFQPIIGLTVAYLK